MEATQTSKHFLRPPPSLLLAASLVSVGVKHDSESSTHGLGWQVLDELCSHESVVTVALVNGSPHHSVFRVFPQSLCLENVSDTLAEVVAGCLLVICSLDLEEGELLALISLTSFKTYECGLVVKSRGVRERQST